jgi:hypothetical protein
VAIGLPQSPEPAGENGENKMKNGTRNWYLVGGKLWFFALAAATAFAQQTTSISLTGVEGPVMGGVYTSPYIATVGGTTGVDVICDDFADESYIPETWTVYVTNMSNLTTTSNPLKWATTGTYAVTEQGSTTLNLTETQAYETAATLAEDILAQNQSTTAGQISAGEYSYALWGLFDSSAFTYLSSQSTTDAGYAAQAESLLYNAASSITSSSPSLSSFSNVTLYTYDPAEPITGSCGGPCTPPQEFIAVSMAEPPSPALLGVDLAVVAGVIVLFRRKMARG